VSTKKEAVLEERINNMLEQNSKEHALMRADDKLLMEKVDEVCNKLEKQFVSKDRFGPVEKIVYGLVGLILSGVIIAVLSLIIKR